MKKFMLLIILVSVTSFGCNSYLNEDVYDILTPNNFFKNENDALVAVNGVYDAIQDNTLWRDLSFTDLLVGSAGHAFNNPFKTLQYEDNQTEIFEIWKLLYVAIARSNSTLEAIENSKLSDNVKLKSEGELRFIRAYSYFYLVRLFANVPLVTKAPKSLDDVIILDPETALKTSSEYYVQRNRNDIYDFIVDDLKFAEENLPASYPSTLSGKATAGAAAGMLAKVYLQRAGKQYDTKTGNLVDGDANYYTLAANQCAKVETMGYSLEPKFSDIFSTDHEIDNTEVLFAIKYINSATAGATGEGNRIVADYGIVRSGPTPYAYNQSNVNQTFYNQWLANNEADDPRTDATFLTYYLDDKGDTVRYGSSSAFKFIKVKKLLSDLKEGVGGTTTATSATDYGNDWIVLRYADVLLMHSEALNESKSVPDAETIMGINKVRARANKTLITLPISKQDLRNAIFNERKWELAYEGQYYYDCQRAGRLLEEIALSPKRSVTPTMRYYIYPIPYNARQANPSLVQNFGW